VVREKGWNSRTKDSGPRNRKRKKARPWGGFKLRKRRRRMVESLCKKIKSVGIELEKVDEEEIKKIMTKRRSLCRTGFLNDKGKVGRYR